MSLAPKIDDVTCFMTDMKPKLAFITGTWLNESISESYLYNAGYNFIYKNRSTDSHGGVVLYINNWIPYQRLDHLHHSNFEVLWISLQGIPSVVLGALYHPRNTDDSAMLNYLSELLSRL
jgi:hypothetical protein